MMGQSLCLAGAGQAGGRAEQEEARTEKSFLQKLEERVHINPDWGDWAQGL